MWDTKNIEAFQKLCNFMAGIRCGKIEETEYLEKLLAQCWNSLEGAKEGGMEGYKLIRRMKDVRWEPPILSFYIERHGAVTLGSGYAEIQEWKIDLGKKTATYLGAGRRQVYKRASPIRVDPIVKEIVALVQANKEDTPFLKWSISHTEVEIRTGKVPGLEASSAVKQTLEGRRRRFRKALIDAMEDAGWEVMQKGSRLTFTKSR